MTLIAFVVGMFVGVLVGVLGIGLAQAARRGDEVQRAAWDEEVDRHARTLDFP